MLDAAAPQASALERLKRSGLAYVGFALRRPEHISVMFDAPVSNRNHPESAEAERRAFDTLTTFIKRCQNKGQLPPGDPLPHALFAWSLVHGVAKLAITGRLPYRSKAGILTFAEVAIDQSFSAHVG